ncbi:MAG: hypothetical protein EXR75_06730 [Myxococcales bacterium]|nr:hypothetical protein [Myxococcales bacterium]
MRPATIFTAVALGLGMATTGCAELSRPHGIEIAKDVGLAAAAALLPQGLVPVPGADGKMQLLPRLNPDGSRVAGAQAGPAAVAQPPSSGG